MYNKFNDHSINSLLDLLSLSDGLLYTVNCSNAGLSINSLVA